MAQSVSVLCEDEAATGRLAADIATILSSGDVLALHGDLGVGKSTFARALIRALAHDEALEVPSPTFTLVQDYDLARCPVSHFDLYRLGSPDELEEIGFFDAIHHAALLIEWPSKAGDDLPSDRLDVTIEPEGRTVRRFVFAGDDAWLRRIERTLLIRTFLDQKGFAAARRQAIQGDASTRAYERLVDEQGDAHILMNAPKQPDGPPIRNGLPYSRIACLAEDVRPFLAIGQSLFDRHLSTPEIRASSAEDGLIVLEDLGVGSVVDETGTIADRYQAAIEVLAEMHSQSWPENVHLPDGLQHHVPAYGLEAMMIEVDLLLDWYVPYVSGARLSDDAEAAFKSLWTELLKPEAARQETWCLRDFHSPNLIWLPDRQGTRRVGLIDFQDAVRGPASYDVASLTRDARVTVSEGMDRDLLTRYCVLRATADASFDEADFCRSHAIMSAQRNTKILGIFARLHMRDSKSGYLRHLPRIHDYLHRSFAHEALQPLASWFEQFASGEAGQ
ncbi:tRNA (adenosine(37)-N6)-threonylcarbamoyltransferase complex ATPase subunit type 1 TsaE [Coralliovum pocilloporae]|uniref:tRNA (adenosine(37)-N6)-threonylcarbamoyltransferase complex ATPase subunit type 1 TsaE n=1 Tax=Coralliovum pocilloporae TaxID=3066369 RepID=UPI00330754E1